MHNFGELRLTTRLDQMRMAVRLLMEAPRTLPGVRRGALLVGQGLRRLARLLPGSAMSLVCVALATALIWLAQGSLQVSNLSLIYLVAVLLVSGVWGLWPGVLAAGVSVVLFEHFFLTSPGGVGGLSRLETALTLSVFVGAAVVTDHLSGRARQRTEEANRRQREIRALYDLSNSIISNSAVDTILPAIAQKVAELFAVRTCSIMLTNAQNELEVRAVYPTVPGGVRADLSGPQSVVTGWVYRNGTPVAVNGRDNGFLRNIAGIADASTPLVPQRAIYAPLTMNGRPVGVMFVGDKLDGARFTQSDLRSLAAFANHAAMALERARLLQEAMDANALRQLDELRAALLSTVSHDLKTPLASIKASVTTLLQPEVAWERATQREFLEEIDEETDRLNRLVSNLLDMSRIEAGVLDPQRDWYDLGEVVGTVLDRLSGLTQRHHIIAEVEEGLPFAPFDYVQIDQVLSNLVENAVKYAPSGTEIRIEVRSTEHELVVGVQDEGDGIPQEELSHVFDKFYRVAKHRSKLISGTGMGLAICRGIVEAHGGRIWAESPPQMVASCDSPSPRATPPETDLLRHRRGERRGARFCFTLPLDERDAAAQTGAQRLSALQRITFGFEDKRS